MEKVDLAERFSRIDEHWRPKIIASLNGQDVKAVKVKGTFPWHRHETVSELFLVVRGVFRVEYRDRVVDLHAGQLTVVPPGVEHRTSADEEAEVLIFEPAGVVNTGDAPTSEFTAPTGVTL
ncbi:MAG: cupin domain-containing protein [Myxococcales bacterium]|nr:cupin domain-containing protein [Myxococcales bacterium]